MVGEGKDPLSNFNDEMKDFPRCQDRRRRGNTGRGGGG